MWILRRNKNYFLFSCKLYSMSPVCLGPSLSSSSDHKPSGCCWVKTWAVASLCPWMCFGYVTSQLTIAKWHGLQELWEKLIWSSCSWKYKSSHFTSEKPEEIIILQKHINPRPKKVLTELIQGIEAKLVEILGYLRCPLWYPEAFFPWDGGCWAISVLPSTWKQETASRFSYSWCFGSRAGQGDVSINSLISCERSPEIPGHRKAFLWEL